VSGRVWMTGSGKAAIALRLTALVATAAPATVPKVATVFWKKISTLHGQCPGVRVLEGLEDSDALALSA